jgi:hypothetical protein
MLVEWENGEITTEPLSVIAADNPVTCAVYAREHDLLDVVLTHLPGKFNPADILSKHWGYQTIWPILPQAYLVLPWRYSRPHSR